MDGETVYLLKPETYMNCSGPAVRELVEYFGDGEGEVRGAGAELIVVLDDLDLPPGRLRFRERGSSGGHRGMQSILEAFGTDAIQRLKVGVGRPRTTDAAGYVLEPLRGEDEEALRGAAQTAATALKTWIADGIDACANRFNGIASQ
jgi:PTH1 family peptidyl-tRNA hydrolase